jgi:hypothetical protein
MSNKHDRSKPTIIAGLLAALLFAFPCPAQTHHRSRSLSDTTLKNFLKQYLKDQGVENDSSARYMSSFVDLNDDGKKEVIVHVISQSVCGTGGCPTLVLAPQLSSFRVVSRISITRPPIRVLNTKSHGWHDLAVWVAGGGIQPGYEAALRFDGESYATNPTVPPAHRLSPQSAGRVVISDNAVPTPLE